MSLLPLPERTPLLRFVFRKMGRTASSSHRVARVPSPRTLRLLLIEDDPHDVLKQALSRAGCRCNLIHVDSEAAFVQHLTPPPDLILAGFTVPHFDALRALAVLGNRHLDIPLIVVGDSMTEETALQAGAAGYLHRDRLERLGTTVQRALEEYHARNRPGHLARLHPLLHGLMETAPNAIVITDAGGRITMVNAEAERMFGYDRGELVGQPVEGLLPEALHDRQHRADEARSRRAMAEGLHTEAHRRNGAPFPVEITLSSFETEEGTFFISTIQDVTARRKAEETLRDSEKKYRSLLNAIPDPVFIFDLETYLFIDCNEAFHHVYGYTRHELTGMTPFDLHPPEERDLVRENINVTGAYRPIRYTHLTREGHRFYVEILSNAIEYQGRPASLSIVRDVSEQQRASDELEKYTLDLEHARMHFEDQAHRFALIFHELDEAKRTAEEARRQVEQAHARLQESQAQLVHSEKMASLGQLAAGVAHEINNPIGFVTSNLNTLARYVDTFKTLLDLYAALCATLPSPTPEQQALLERLERFQEEEDVGFIRQDVEFLLAESSSGLLRVKEIAQSLKSFARADEAEWQDADLNAGLEATLRVIWNELKYTCEVVCNLNPLPRIRCHPGQLNQVFMNLLINAAQAIEDKGQITIETAVVDREIVVRITDTGCGVAPENLEKLFNPFFTTKPVGQGTGLGLSISFGIVRKHGGRIEVESEVGRGTTFSVYLPLEEARAEEARAEAPA